MKSLGNLMLVLLLSLTTTAGFSQVSSKPTLFSGFPNSINCSANEFSNAFIATAGQHIVLSFSENFKFSGTVVSNVTKYGNLQSLVIKSDQSEKCIFHLSRQMLDDQTISFVGRIISPDASDGYQIKKDPGGNYRFEKMETEKVLQDCHL